MKKPVLSLILHFAKSHILWYGFAPVVALTLALAAGIGYGSTDIDNADNITNGIYRMSQNLTYVNDKQKISMPAWKDEIIEFAEKYPKNIILNAGTTEKVVALTFDDGPDPTITPGIIDILDQYNVKATFFFIGSNIKDHADVVQKAYDCGFQVAGHSYSHPHLTDLSDEDVLNEINDTTDLFIENLNVRPAYIRPPYGDIDDRIVGLLGDLKIILWSIDPADWAVGSTASEIANYIIDNVQPGDIILMHSTPSSLETLNAVPLIIESLRAKDYSFCTVEDLVGVNAYISN